MQVFFFFCQESGNRIIVFKIGFEVPDILILNQHIKTWKLSKVRISKAIVPTKLKFSSGKLRVDLRIRF